MNPSVETRVRLLAAEDEAVLRHALADLIEHEPLIKLVGFASDADQAISLAERFQPDVALLDVRMPGGGGPAAARGIRSCSPGTRILAYSAYDDRASVVEMLRAGAVGYVVKGASDDPVVAVIRASRGERVLSEEVLFEVMGELSGRLEDDERRELKLQGALERIRTAASGEGLEFQYQPIVDLVDGSLAAVEALARFGGEPTRTPDKWFEEAGQVGLQAQLECAAIKRAVARIDSVPASARLSVNVSPSTIVGREFRELASNLPMHRMVLEITEHAYVEDYPRLRQTLAAIQIRGGQIAIDDAGAGFASLRHIVQMAPAIIKLDMSLVRGVDGDPARRALVSGLASFASEVGADIVAEGIETPDELHVLRSLGVRYGQGFYLARPSSLPAPIRYRVDDNSGTDIPEEETK
jgi:EAL domain-containing protein (putative c-di-GMP-specific phosphodiesterase class I)/ActR/RegA family two-component response regulator